MVKPDFVVTFMDATEATLKFTVREFSDIQGPRLSPPCYLLNIPWRILIMPRAIQDDTMAWSKRYLGYFLRCNAESTSDHWSCYAIAELALLSCHPDIPSIRKRLRHSFDSKHNNYGFNFYILWDDILNPDKGYIVDDTINLELHLITEAPKSLGILCDWGDFVGRICVPRKKWSNAGASIYKRNLLFAQENKTKNHLAEELVELMRLKDDELEDRFKPYIPKIVEEDIEDEDETKTT